MKILVPGGAGYIGSHMVKLLQENDHDVTVLDNFSTGNAWAVSDCKIIEVDLIDKEGLFNSLKGMKYDGIIHFAAKSIVQESVENPEQYFQNNYIGSKNLIDCILEYNISNNFVFSSTAAVYGNPKVEIIHEECSTLPINPYGESKLMVERYLKNLFYKSKFNSISLRYFNAAGAHGSSEIGEQRKYETHLIPNILNSVINKTEELKIYGDNYPTKDGTCIRDYIHVNDLAEAHLKAINLMQTTNICEVINLGSGVGFSIKEILDECSKVTKSQIEFDKHPPRPGDPATLIADIEKALHILDWRPKHSNISNIISSAWNWHKKAFKDI
jgi:UDP-glucose 4-epimerase